MGFLKRKDKKDRKPFYQTKFGNFLFTTKVGNYVMESAQTIPGVGHAITLAKRKFEKDCIAFIVKNDDTPAGDGSGMDIINNIKIPDMPKFRKRFGLILLFVIIWSAIKTWLPAFAANIEEFIPWIWQWITA